MAVDDEVNTFPILVVGSGKLASELLSNLGDSGFARVQPWTRRSHGSRRTIVVHAGSGRELDEVCRFCAEHGSMLVELATSTQLDGSLIHFPTIVCSNTNVLVLKFLAMVRRYGHHFSEYDIEILESHQSTKSSKPGTAISLARFLGLDPSRIKSVRDPEIQMTALKMEPDQLLRHAYHRIQISDGNAVITLETKVLGEAPYSSGLAQILKGVQGRSLEPRIYDVVDLVAEGWIKF